MDNITNNQNIIPVDIVQEMKKSYIDYSMSVIISRALPDVRDGLKPVHRRVLYGMIGLGLSHKSLFKKSARIVGEILGKYHPHGDSSVYDAMVRMAQAWSLRYPFVDGQGNFGSIDGDEAAAMRYTEARLKIYAEYMMEDIDKDTIDFQPNFDESLQEPSVLPSSLPNLLINGSSGIAVGMATNIPPHNLSEIIDGIIAYIDNNDISIDELITYIPGPDFPTGGIICGTSGIKEAYNTGRGKITIKSKTQIEETSHGKNQIIVTEIPYMVNKALLIEHIAQLVNDKIIEGISDIRDESDRDGLRIVIDLKKDAIPQIVLNVLFKNTALQSNFNVNNLALVKGAPKILSLKDLIKHFYEHRYEVVRRRTHYELEQAKKKLHILEGLIKAIENLDDILIIIRQSKNLEEIFNILVTKYGFTNAQNKAILDMKLQKLTTLEQEKLIKEQQNLSEYVNSLTLILSSDDSIKNIIKDELLKIKQKSGDTRRTKIEYDENDFSTKDLIPDDDVVLILSKHGYIKVTPLDEYRLQNRGGVGIKATSDKITDDNDVISKVLLTSMHQMLLIFTNEGKIMWKNVYQLPKGTRLSKGRAIQNIFEMNNNVNIQEIISLRNFDDIDFLENHYLIFCTKRGIIKKTLLKAFSRPMNKGIYAININEDDELISVQMTNGNHDIIIAAHNGKAIRFHEEDVRPMGRTATGVRGITLNKDDFVIGMVSVDLQAINDSNLLVVSSKGYGKKSSIEDYRITKRGGKGVKTINITSKTGLLTSIENVKDDDELLITNSNNISIRFSLKSIRTLGRNTQGVKLIKLDQNVEVVSIAKLSI